MPHLRVPGGAGGGCRVAHPCRGWPLLTRVGRGPTGLRSLGFEPGRRQVAQLPAFLPPQVQGGLELEEERPQGSGEVS